MYKIAKQIKIGFLFRMIAILFSYILVPMTLKYLGKEQYGLWLTLLSVVSWISFLDIGIGNGMRNRLAESIALNDFRTAKIYVSTSYIILIGFALIFFLIIYVVTGFIDLAALLNSKAVDKNNLCLLVRCIAFFISINFVLSLINQVVNATHNTAFTAFNQALANAIALISTYVAVKTTTNNLFLIAIIYCSALSISNILFSLYYYLNNPHIAPSICDWDKSKIKSISSLGVKIFIIQIAAMIVFTTDNIVISHFLNPKSVTEYNIINKLFSVVIMAHAILMGPLWSAFTDAYTNRNFIWIRSALKKLNLLMLPLVLTLVAIVFASKTIIYLWVGGSVVSDYSLTIYMAFFVAIICWNNIYAYFLNGISATRLQLITSIIAILLKISILYLFYSTNKLSLETIVVSSIIALFPFALLGYLQTYKFIAQGEYEYSDYN